MNDEKKMTKEDAIKMLQAEEQAKQKEFGEKVSALQKEYGYEFRVVQNITIAPIQQ